MTVTENSQSLGHSPFHLKRHGDFEKALKGYGEWFAGAQESGNRFLSEMCFDQIFDLQLLLYVRHKKQFDSGNRLRQQLESDVRKAVNTELAVPSQDFDRFFTSCWRRHSPRGRGRTPFSVDRATLIPELRARDLGET